MRLRSKPTFEQVSAVLLYDPIDGVLRHRVDRVLPNGGVRFRAGTEVSAAPHGADRTVRLTTCGWVCLYSHVVWLLCKRKWPEKTIDHIDGNPSNNRVANLREASMAEQAQNITTKRHNQSGLIGAHYHRAKGTYRARITVNGQVFNLGSFRTAEQAHEAYKVAKRTLHTFNPEQRTSALHIH